MTRMFSTADVPADAAGVGSGAATRGAVVGTLAGFDGEGTALVDFPANPFLHPVAARSCVDLAMLDVGRDAVLWFEGDDPSRPLVMGVIRPPARAGSFSGGEIEIDAASLAGAMTGQHVEVAAVRTLTLRCGRSSITLTREGRVQVSGVYVETRASGTNRVRGGAVRIN